MVEAEPIDQVLEVDDPVPPPRVDHPHGSVGHDPQPRVAGIERVPRHRGQIDQFVDRVGRRIRRRHRGNVGHLKLATVQAILQVRDPDQVVPQLPRPPLADVGDPLVAPQPLRHERPGHRGQLAAIPERPAHMVTGRTARRRLHHPRLTRRGRHAGPRSAPERSPPAHNRDPSTTELEVPAHQPSSPAARLQAVQRETFHRRPPEDDWEASTRTRPPAAEPPTGPSSFGPARAPDHRRGRSAPGGGPVFAALPM